MGILSVCMCLPNICTWGQQRVEECVILPGTGVLDNFELLCECLNLNSGPLREQPVLLPGEPPLQPQPRASHPLASTSTGEITGEITGITVMPRFNSMLGNDFRVLFILRQALYQLRYFPAHWWFKKNVCMCLGDVRSLMGVQTKFVKSVLSFTLTCTSEIKLRLPKRAGIFTHWVSYTFLLWPHW